MKKITIYLSIWMALVLTACSKSDTTYPSIITDYVDAISNSSALIDQILTDDGIKYDLSEPLKGENLAPDSLYRALCKYEISKENPAQAKSYSMKLIVSPNPVLRQNFKADIITDPATGLQSIWRSGNYVNLVIKVMVHGDTPHSYHFINDGIITENDGTKTLSLMLYHNRNKDIEGWNETVNLSIPMTRFKETLHTGDHVQFSMNTYEGLKSWTVDY